MTTVALDPTNFNPTQFAALTETVRNGLGVEPTLWLEHEENWHRISLLEQDLQLDPAEPPVLVSELSPTSRITSLQGASGTLQLAIELPRCRSRRIAAHGEIVTSDPQLALRLAEGIRSQCEQSTAIFRLDLENKGLLRQVTNDLEELTFLRRMAELLEISELSFDLKMMAEAIFPALRPLCEAEALVFVAGHVVEDDGVEYVQVDDVELYCGERVTSESTCVRLVDQFRELCQDRPLVRNNLPSSTQEVQFPGINGFILVPVVNSKMVIGWLLALNRTEYESMFDEELPWEISYREFGTTEATLMSSAAAILATHSRNVDLFREREELLVSMVRALVSAIEAKDEYTRGHSERVARYARRLAEEIGMGEDFCQRLYLTGLLHDIGKIGVRDAVLRKQGPLTDSEFEEIKQHVEKGWAILQDLDPLSYVLPGVLHHHEELDGKGYPDGLAGSAIPLEGRILAVADAYDAMTSDRPYRPGMPHEKAEAIMLEGSGKQWDPELIDAFFQAMPDILRIKRNYVPRAPTKRK